MTFPPFFAALSAAVLSIEVAWRESFFDCLISELSALGRSFDFLLSTFNEDSLRASNVPFSVSTKNSSPKVDELD
eukprot:CAMPEP_0171305264 /NCGR_PEP_ID=MMETSP0816-20121228/15066_1 /TAXON_ID=420281 /ORGANISM="Proboscia inermis, Strain CCAP1064/1" /LENGTH=74 /DNA_ID=CAMNT_0011785957 /DNA_START=1462 /DNA_END=1683 /DNA_ORIENTATION=-